MKLVERIDIFCYYKICKHFLPKTIIFQSNSTLEIGKNLLYYGFFVFLIIFRLIASQEYHVSQICRSTILVFRKIFYIAQFVHRTRILHRKSSFIKILLYCFFIRQKSKFTSLTLYITPKFHQCSLGTSMLKAFHYNFFSLNGKIYIIHLDFIYIIILYKYFRLNKVLV